MELDQLLVILFLMIICGITLIIPGYIKNYKESRKKKVNLDQEIKNNPNWVVLEPGVSRKLRMITKEDLLKEAREKLMEIHKKINNELYILGSTLDYSDITQEIVEVLESYRSFLGEEWVEKKKNKLRGICSWEELKIKLLKIMWD